MKELEFDFRTVLRLSGPVREHVFSLHCLPREDETQQLRSYGIQLEPAVGYELRKDGFENWLVCGACNAPHTEFVYAAHGIARVNKAKRRAEPGNPVYRYPTALTQPDAAVHALWQSLPLEGLAPAAQAELLNHAAARALHYQHGATTNQTTAAQALSGGKGVCQDYAHLLLALARLSGFGARYCMGLIPGEGATHAWVELALPEGWTGFDPTHDAPAGEDHLCFAVGRDAADCRTERGTFRGSVSQQMDVRMILRER